MEFLTLNTGAQLPMIGFGTWDVRGEEGKRSILDALELGYRLVDTALMYKNHAIVGAALRESGLLCWLRRPLELLPTEGRPLSTDLPGLYRQREPLYRAAADFSVENTGLPKAAAEAAARGLDLR